MKNLISAFLDKTGWKKFAQVDFEHYLNRNGIAIPSEDVNKMLTESILVIPTQDGMWRKRA
jgi:hypothetical protein